MLWTSMSHFTMKLRVVSWMLPDSMLRKEGWKGPRAVEPLVANGGDLAFEAHSSSPGRSGRLQ